MRFVGARRGLRYGVHVNSPSPPPSTIFLPRVGPYASAIPRDVSTLPNISYNSNFILGTCCEEAGTVASSPILANTFTLSNCVLTSVTNAIFIRCNRFIIDNAFMDVSGSIGGNASFVDLCGNPAGQGGNGGSGGSGGGGGGGNIFSACQCPPFLGGVGGDGTNGDSGMATAPGNGGPGYGGLYIDGFGWTWPVGGNRTSGSSCSAPNGPWGFGGDGGNNISEDQLAAGGGGGGGAGLILVMANQVIRLDCNGSLIAKGGDGGQPIGACGEADVGWAGSGGVITVFSKQYDSGSFDFNCNPGLPVTCGLGTGNFVLYEVDHDGTSILNTYENDDSHNWNNV